MIGSVTYKGSKFNILFESVYSVSIMCYNFS